MPVLEADIERVPDRVANVVEKPVIEVDLDDTLLKDVNFNASRFVVRHSAGKYGLVQVFSRGRVEVEDDPLLHRLRQDYFGNSWHLARAKPSEGAVEALERASEVVTVDILTGRPERLRPTLEGLLTRTGMMPFINGEIHLRGIGVDYRHHKLKQAQKRQAEGAVDDDTQAILDFSRAKIFTVAIEQQWNHHLTEDLFIKKALSFRSFVNELATYSSWEAMVKDHHTKVELQRLARTYHHFRS